MEITLVSGLTGSIRPLKGSELKAVGSPSALRTGDSVNLMLRACFSDVTDPGPYSWLEPGGKVDWGKALSGDRFDALLQIRALTFGPDYDFKTNCLSCKAAYDWAIDVRDLPRRELAASVREHVRTVGNAFELTAPDGKLVRYRLSTGEDEKQSVKAKKAAGGAWSPLDAILQMATEIEGVGKMPQHRPKLDAYLQDLTWPHVLEIFNGMEETNCGIDTSFETKCPHCRHEQTIDLPFGAAFFSPPPKKKSATTEETKAKATGMPTKPQSAAPTTSSDSAAPASSTTSADPDDSTSMTGS